MIPGDRSPDEVHREQPFLVRRHREVVAVLAALVLVLAIVAGVLADPQSDGGTPIDVERVPAVRVTPLSETPPSSTSTTP